MINQERLGAPLWAWGIWGVVALGTLIAVPHLPPRIPIHYGVNGQPNGYANRWMGAFMLPIIMLLLLLSWKVLWRIDPKRQNYSIMASTYRYLGGLVVGFLGFVQTWLMLQSLHAVIWNSTRLIGTLSGLLIALLANVLPRVQANWWIGIRTPWTLSSEWVWRKTHQLGGHTGVIAGLLIMAANILAPTRWAGIATVVVILAWAILLSIASYWFSAHPGNSSRT